MAMTTDEASVPRLITPIMPKMNHPISGMNVEVVGIWSLTFSDQKCAFHPGNGPNLPSA